MTKARAFVLILLSFIIGVGIRSFIEVPMFVIAGINGLGIISLFIFRERRKKIVFCLICIFCTLGIIRYDLSLPKDSDETIKSFNGAYTLFTAVVIEEPDVRQDHTKLTVEVKEVNFKVVTGRVLVRTQLYPEYQYGDLLQISCELQTPEPIEDFSYDKYLARYNIYSLCYRPGIELVDSNEGNPVMNVIFNIKKHFTERINRVVPEPEASFLNGLILGAKHAIPDWLIESFHRTGTTHLIALSGYNITIIAVFIQNFCKALWIPRKKAFWVSLGAITFFILMTGAQASIVRAGIMGGLVLLARKLGRMSRITNALAFAAFIMLLANPKVLAFDAGFQLSFAATIGLVYLSPHLEKVFKRLPNVFEIRSSLVATLSAIILTTPLILMTFGRFSLIAPIVNVVILPLIPFAMALGFLTGILSIISLPIGMISAWFAWGLLRFILLIIESSATLPHVSLVIPAVHWMWGVALYSALGFFLFRKKKKNADSLQVSKGKIS